MADHRHKPADIDADATTPWDHFHNWLGGRLFNLGAGLTAPAEGYGLTWDATKKWFRIAQLVSAITSLTANNWKTWYSNGSGVVTELALPVTDKYLRGTGVAAAPDFHYPEEVASDTTSVPSTDGLVRTFNVATGKAEWRAPPSVTVFSSGSLSVHFSESITNPEQSFAITAWTEGVTAA